MRGLQVAVVDPASMEPEQEPEQGIAKLSLADLVPRWIRGVATDLSARR